MKYLIIDQAIYWEQMYARLLNHVDNNCDKIYKEPKVIFILYHLPFSSLAILFLVLPNNFIVQVLKAQDNTQL